MPLQNILVSEAHQRMSESSDPTTVAMPVGQIVGRMNEIRPVADIIAELVSGFDQASKRLDDIRKAERPSSGQQLEFRSRRGFSVDPQLDGVATGVIRAGGDRAE